MLPLRELFFPINDPQVGDSPKLIRIVGHKGEVICHGDRRNKQIVRTNRQSPLTKLQANLAIDFRCVIIKRQRYKSIKETSEFQQVLFGAGALQSAKIKLCLDHRAEYNFPF